MAFFIYLVINEFIVIVHSGWKMGNINMNCGNVVHYSVMPLLESLPA